MTRDQRRLAAIISADVVGYSLLMGRDDSATLAALKSHRHDLIDPKIAEYGGRIVKSTGDGLLLEFPSVVDAVRCAVDVQRGMAERNTDVPAEGRLEFRIGINVGDIIIDGDDIFGDGINVAARLQTLAEPGGICVSRVVRDQVVDKLSFAFEDLGSQQVKNISRPVEAYRVDLGSAAVHIRSPARNRWQRLTRSLGGRWIVGGILAVALAVTAVWTLAQFWKAAAPAPSPPPYSVAVLPFAAPEGNPSDERFADSLTNDLTMALGRARLAHVVSHSLAMTYKGKAIDARTVGRELNVRYIVQGEVRRAGERILVNAQLIDTAGATQLWSDHLEVDPAQAASNPAAIVARLTRRVRDAENATELRRVGGPLPPGASALELTLHAQAVYLKDTCATRTDCVKAIVEADTMLEQALRLDPNLVQAMILRSWTLNDHLWADLRADHERLVQQLDEVSTRAVATDPTDAFVWVARTYALMWQGRWQAALEANTNAMNLDPYLTSPYIQRASTLIHMGQPAEALTWLDKGFALESQSNSITGLGLFQRCRAYQALGRYDDAIAACEKAIAQSDWWAGHAYLVAAYAQKGETAKSDAEKIILLNEQSGITIADLKAQRLSNEPAYLQQTETHFYAGLRKAGIPEKQ